MSDPQKQTEPPDPLHYVIIGAVPALIGTVFVLSHLRDPLLPDDHDGFLVGAWVVLLGWAIASWQQYHRKVHAARAEERHQALTGQLASLQESNEHLTKSVRGTHRRAETIERQCKAIGAAFVDEDTPINGSRPQGPRLV